MHHAALAHAEIANFMAELRTQNGVAALALQFVILTACRVGEVIGARWSEIDRDAKIWTIPGREDEGGASSPGAFVGRRVGNHRRNGRRSAAVKALLFRWVERETPGFR